MAVDELEKTPGAGEAGGLGSRAVREGGRFLGFNWVAQILSWGVTLGVARLLVPEDYGVMAAAAMLLGLSDTLAEAGVGRALVHKETLGKTDDAEAFTLSLLLSAACYAVLVAGSGLAARFLKTPELTGVLPVMGAVVLMIPFRTIPLGLLDRRLAWSAQGSINMTKTVIQSSVVLGLAWCGARYWSLVIGALIARLFECVALARHAAWRPRLALPGPAAAALLRYGVWMSLGSLLWYVYSNSDYAVVGRVAGPVALGYYSLAFQLMSLPAQKVAANVNQMSFPVFCRLRDEPGRVKDWYLRLNALMAAMILPALVGAALVAGDGIGTVFGAKWLPAVVPFQVLSAVGLLSVLSSSQVSLLNALGRPDINLRYTATCAVVFPFAFAFAGERYDVIGVCVTWCVVYSVAVGLLIGLTRGITGVSIREVVQAQLPSLFACLIMTGPVLLVRHLLGDHVPGAARLAAAVVVGVLAYAAGLLVAGRVVLDDFKIVLRELKG